MKNKISILVSKGVIQMIMVDDKKVQVNIFDLDSDAELEQDWDEVTREQEEVALLNYRG